MTPEGSVKADIKKLLDSYGSQLYYFMPVPTGYGKRTVDYLICFHGIFVAVEAKRAGGKPRRFQRKILDQIAVAGGTGITVDDVKQLADLLRDIANRAAGVGTYFR